MDETNELHKTIKGRETSRRSDCDHWKRLDGALFWSQCSTDQFSQAASNHKRRHRNTWLWSLKTRLPRDNDYADCGEMTSSFQKPQRLRQASTKKPAPFHLFQDLLREWTFFWYKGAEIRNNTKGFLMISCVQKTFWSTKKRCECRKPRGLVLYLINCLIDNFTCKCEIWIGLHNISKFCKCTPQWLIITAWF